MNIWNNSSSEYYSRDKEAIQKPPTTTIKSEHKPDTLTRVEQVIEQETTLEHIAKETQADKEYKQRKADLNPAKNNTEEQIQAIMEQVIIGSSPDTNSTEVEIIDLTVNELVLSEIHIANVLDTKNNTLAQQANQSSKHSESHFMETTTKATQPEDTEWLDPPYMAKREG
ncbi:8610_t:CDS:2, partial [Gigaspora rosea]